jgi:hypothetical protein
LDAVAADATVPSISPRPSCHDGLRVEYRTLLDKPYHRSWHDTTGAPQAKAGFCTVAGVERTPGDPVAVRPGQQGRHLLGRGLRPARAADGRRRRGGVMTEQPKQPKLN